MFAAAVPLVLCVCLPVRPLFERNGRTDATAAAVAAMLVGGWLELFNDDDDGNNVRDLLEIIFRGQDRCCAPGWLVGWMDAFA